MGFLNSKVEISYMLVEGFELLKKYNIPIPEYWINDIPENLEYPVVLKADLFHKTEEKAVILNIKNFSQLAYNYYLLKERFPDKKIIVQKQLVGNYIEMIIGIKKDKTFNYFILVGLGGIYAELIRDFIILVPEFDFNDLTNMIKNLKYYKMLTGYRNLPSINFEVLYDIIKKLERLFLEEKMEEIEINPLMINDKEAYAVDVRFIR